MNLINLFANETDVTECAAGECVFKEGSHGARMYVVIEGEVALSVRGVVIETVRPGELFGEMALIDEEPRSATATANTNCRLAAVNESRFTYMVQQTPFFALHVMRVLARRLRTMDNTIN